METDVICRDGGVNDLIGTRTEEQIWRDGGSEEKNDERTGGKRNGGMSCVSEERAMTGNSWEEFGRRRTDRERGMM